MNNNSDDYYAISNILEKWDLNKITEEQLVLTKTIAQGGQGKVKIGKYFSMHVIVKILLKLKVSTFTTEILNAYKYRHPNIPKFIGIYESSKHYGIVMEYVDGITLTKMITLEKQGKITLSLAQKLDYLIQLTSVIEFLHSHLLMHRDLKPDNIMIDHLGNLKLIDFGIALAGTEKWINLDSEEFSLTPNYMAPEIALQAQEDYDENDDDYVDDEDIYESENEEEPEKATDKKISETYNNQSWSSLEKIRIKFNQLAQTEEYKNAIWNKGKWILITNKYDVWTFGIIMAQLFTRCKPWCRNERETISEMESQTRLISQLPYPIYVLHPQEECRPYEERLKTIIRKCLIYDPDERVNISQVKADLLEIFNVEVKNKIHLEHLRKIRQINKENKRICDILKQINEEKKREFVRMNKLIIRQKINFEKINELNDQINKDKRTENKEANEEIQILISRLANRNSREKNEFGNTMLNILKKANLIKQQKLSVFEHMLFDKKTDN